MDLLYWRGSRYDYNKSDPSREIWIYYIGEEVSNGIGSSLANRGIWIYYIGEEVSPDHNSPGHGFIILERKFSLLSIL
jgi:hypothetical protein